MAPPKAAGGAVGSFPPMTPDSVQRYQAMFAQLDGDHDGWVQVRCPAAAGRQPGRGCGWGGGMHRLLLRCDH